MSTTVADTLADRLAAHLPRVLGGDAAVRELRRLSGGASRETWAFTADLAGGPRRLILRRDPPSEPRPEQMRQEAVAWRAARAHGVPGPDILDSADTCDTLGAPYLLVTHVEGETIPRRILRDERYARTRSVLTADLGRAAAAIHAVDAAEVAGLRAPDVIEQHWEWYLATGVARPVLDLALRWLDAHRPGPPQRRSLVHGDFRLGNVIVDEHGLRAVLDWELAHLGDPMEDLGWLCIRAWRFGGPGPVAGVGAFTELFDAYEQAGGIRPDPGIVRWWQVLGTLSWGVGCLMQVRRHLSGATRSIELAAVGRRVAEQEHDLLAMIT